MKTKRPAERIKSIKEEPEPVAGPVNGSGEPSPTPSADKPTLPRIPLNPDGSIDFGSMRGSTLDRLKEAINKTPGLKAEVIPIDAARMFRPEMLYGLIDVVGQLETLLAINAFKVPEPVARRVFPYTPNEKQLLAPAVSAVLNKHIPDWMLKWQEEFQLASLVTSLTLQKINAAMMLSKMQPVSQAESTAGSEKPPEDVKTGTMN